MNISNVKQTKNSRPEKESFVSVKKYGKYLVKQDFKRNWELYLLVLPVILFYAIFSYKPMYGLLMAFQQYVPNKGIWGSPWIGFRNFQDFFNSFYFARAFLNTITISFTSILFGFPMPIILALMMNELRNKWFTRSVQTITYLPHFISVVVISGIIRDFVTDTGIIGQLVGILTHHPENLLNNPKFFVPIYVTSEVWQTMGWSSIIYMAALMGIDSQLYEAASIDGAGRFKQLIHVTIPGILSTIIIMLILRMGGILQVGFEKIILLYNSAIYDTADVISTFSYRKGLQEQNFGYGAAVGLFNAVINFIFLYSANKLSKKMTQMSLW